MYELQIWDCVLYYASVRSLSGSAVLQVSPFSLWWCSAKVLPCPFVVAQYYRSVKRVRTRVVVVVMVVRELLFLVTSVICMRIRGRGQKLPQFLPTFV